jgi:hypothetical protein
MWLEETRTPATRAPCPLNPWKYEPSGNVGRNIQEAFLSSAWFAVTTKETPAPVPQLTLQTAILPRIRLIRRGKGPRRKFSSHLKARGSR